MTLITAKEEPEKVVKKKVYLSKNKKILLDFVKPEEKIKKKDGSN